MAKSLRQINIDFQNSKKQADTIEDCANRMRNTRKQLEDIIGELNCGWKGDAATAYLNKCEQLMKKMDKTSKNLEQLSTGIKRTAKVYYDAERRAYEIAQRQEKR